MKIRFCQGTYGERIEQTKECLNRIAASVDECTIIIDETVTKDQIIQLGKINKNVVMHVHPWEDSMPKMRNQYLSYCEEGDWVIVSDPDEWFCEEFCKDLKKIVEEAEQRDIQLLLINSHDVEVQADGTKKENVSTFFKNLIFKYKTGVRYEGVGERRTVHETLLFAEEVKTATLPRKYYYLHVKTYVEVKERGARNVWIGGGGNNVGARNPFWKELREITDLLELKSWPEVRTYVRKGKIDSRLKEVIIKHKDDSGWDWENESRDWFLWYSLIHPEEVGGITSNPKPPSKGSPAEVMSYVEQTYKSVLGREADDTGKRAYTNAIVMGKIIREDLPELLKSSPEHKQKFGEAKKVVKPAAEKLKVDVPVDVNVSITSSIFRQALMRSRTYWYKIKAKLDFGDKWLRLLSIARKEETSGRGVDESEKSSFEPWVKMFAEYAPAEKYQNILDVGAGSGCETAVLKDYGYNVIGITFGRENIDYAKEHYDIQLLEMDMHNLQFPENFFDGAYLQQTFEHAISGWMLVIELRKILRVGGRVFIDVPDPNDEPMYTIWHINLLYPRQIRHLFEMAGFKLVKDLTEKHRIHMIFEKLADNTFESWAYIQYILKKEKT